jgi:hypothetical protein
MPILHFYTGIPVFNGIARGGNAKCSRHVMNSTKRFFFGVISTLLLAVGLARAADRLDPMSQSLRPTAGDIVVSDGPVPPCSLPCAGGDDGSK